MDEMMELIKDYNNYMCFTFYENEKTCEITIYNNEEVLRRNIVSEEEGKKNLLTFCLNWRCLEVLPYIDTIGLRNGDKINGFVRYMESQGVIKDFRHDLIPKFICDFLEVLQEQYKEIVINSGFDSYCNPEMRLIGKVKEEHFYMYFIVDIKRYFSYVISNYMSRHENVNIQEVEARENSNQIILDGIEFSSELLNKEQREYFYSQIRERDKEDYVQFLESPFGQKVMQGLGEQDSMQRVRTKLNVTSEEQ